MSSVIRVNSGDTIQIREGVLQGIGPQGPVGPTGPRGNDGPAGPQGLPGPTGQINDFYLSAHNVGNTLSLAANSLTAVSFPTVEVDQPSLLASLTNVELPVGLWMFNLNVNFLKPSSANATGWRRVSLSYDGTEVRAVSQDAIPTHNTEMILTAFVPVGTPDLIAQLRVEQSDTVSIAVVAKLVVTRIGPGATGASGPTGPDGPAGPVGPTGPQGPAGSLVDNTTTFAAIGG